MTTPKTTHLPLSTVRLEEASPLTGTDAIAVHELLNRVYLAEDTRDGDALRQCVTTDFVQVHSLFGTLSGREAFARWVLDNPQFFDGIRHQAVNSTTRTTGPDSAQAVSYILVFQLFSDDGATAALLPRIIGHGVVTDSVSRDGGIWRLAHRTYDQFSLLPDFVPDAAIRSKASEIADPNK
jgi:hypothetical protein